MLQTRSCPGLAAGSQVLSPVEHMTMRVWSPEPPHDTEHADQPVVVHGLGTQSDKDAEPAADE